VTTTGIGPVAASLVLLVLCYWRTLAALAQDWIRTDTAQHGIPVLLFVTVSLWRDRAELGSLERIPFRPGFLLLVWGGVQAIVASLGAELFLSRTAFFIALTGIVLFHLGWRFVRATAVLWILLYLTVPLPAILYNPVVVGLQSLASQINETTLALLNIPLRWDGNSMAFAGGGEQVRPMEAFASLRLAMALVCGAISYGSWTRRKLVRRIALILGILLIALGLSALRISAVAWLDETVSAAWALRVLERVGPWIVALASLATLAALDQGLTMWQKRRKATDA
jgi:exosortase